VPNIAEGIAKGRFGAAFVALPFLVISWRVSVQATH
jgi:hypothetical protein